MAFDNGELSSMWMGMENCGVFLRPASAARMATHPRTASSDGILGRILGRQGGEIFDVACRGPRLLLEQLQPQDHAGRAPACSPHPRASARAPSPPPPPPNRRGLGARGFRPPRPGRARRPRPLPPLRHEPPPATPAMGLITHDESRGGPLRPLCHGRSGGGATARGGRRGGELFLLKAV